MFTRVIILFAIGAGLAACQPAVPDSGLGVPDPGRGVGFSDTPEARAQALGGPIVPEAQPVAAQPLGATDDGSAEATAAETRRVLAATSGNNSTATGAAGGPLAASPTNAPPPLVDGSGISQENSFDAVSAQRGIEGDAARIAANRAQYQVAPTEALPDRSNAGPNIVAYALANTHPIGTKVYTRVGLNKQAKFERACAQYASGNEAQIAFLEAGGPSRDRSGMDPDGDGYACNWDPRPFRLANSG